jgi:hypothetical protein
VRATSVELAEVSICRNASLVSERPFDTSAGRLGLLPSMGATARVRPLLFVAELVVAPEDAG